MTEILSRLGWRWIVLTSTIGKLYKAGLTPHVDIISLLRFARNKIESGCYSVCEVTCDLEKIEASIFPEVLKLGFDEGDKLLTLISNAMSGKIAKEDLDIESIRPILSDCAIIPCACNYQFIHTSTEDNIQIKENRYGYEFKGKLQ